MSKNKEPGVKYVSKSVLAKKLGVARQTVNDWANPHRNKIKSYFDPDLGMVLVEDIDTAPTDKRLKKK